MNAGVDSTTNTTEKILSGSQQGDVLGVFWQVFSEPGLSAEFENNQILNAKAINLYQNGDYIFRLVGITDGDNVSDAVKVTVNAPSSLSLGGNYTVTGSTHKLDGYARNITSGNAIGFTQQSGPNTAGFSSSSSPSGEIDYNLTGLVAGTYIFRLSEMNGLTPVKSAYSQVEVS